MDWVLLTFEKTLKGRKMKITIVGAGNAGSACAFYGGREART